MKLRVKLKKLHNRVILSAFSHSKLIRYKLKYFIQSNELYLIDETKKLKDTDGFTQRINKVQLSLEVRYEVKKNDLGDKLLIIQLMKQGSRLDDKIHNLESQLQSLFNGNLLEKSNEMKFVEYVILYKESKEQEKCNLLEEIYFDPKGQISLSKRNSWEYEKNPHLLLGGNSGTGKSYLLFSIIHKMRQEAKNENIYICDGKFDELEEVAKNKFQLKTVASSVEQIKTFIEDVEERMESIYLNKEKNKNNDAIFLVIDEFAALSLVIDKKEWQELNKKIKNIILKGRASNIHVLIAMQRASSDSIDLAIRDNTAVKIGLGNLSAENFRMIFGENRGDNDILKRDRGQGYILIDGQNLKMFDSPYIEMN